MRYGTIIARKAGKFMKILVINGPNLNLLGTREPTIYGNQSYAALLQFLEETAREAGVDIGVFQSNHEGAIVDRIQQAIGNFDGLIINPAAYTHTSIAIPDAISAGGIPTVEVHLSDISDREDFRKISYTSRVCKKVIMGKGFAGYAEAILYLEQNFQG